MKKDFKKKFMEHFSLKLTFICFILVGIVFSLVGFQIYSYVNTTTAYPTCELVTTEEIISGIDSGGIKMECHEANPSAVGDFAVKYKLWYVFLPFVTISILFDNEFLKIIFMVLNVAYFFVMGSAVSWIVVYIVNKSKAKLNRKNK